MSGICRSDAYVNNAGTGAPNFTYGLTCSTSQVVQADTITNAAGSGAPNFSHGITTSTGQTLTIDTINNATSNGGVAIQGIAGSTAAASGYIGQYVTSVVSTSTNYGGSGSGNTLALASITLGAGDWDIWASLIINGNGTTFNSNSSSQVAIGTVSGSTTSGGVVYSVSQYSFQALAADVTGGAIGAVINIVPFQILLASSTTYYLNTYVNYTGTAPQAAGAISARRRR